tara:strand:+ start:79023 stop:79907 length:885 start_codon:yes stop_codon:yes gene_type:complete
MVRFTSEEMKGIMKQPQDSCPFFNNVIQTISKRIEDFDYKNITKVNEDIYDNIYKAFDIIDDIKKWSIQWENLYNDSKNDLEKDSFITAFKDSAYNAFDKQKDFNKEKEISDFKNNVGIFTSEVRNLNIKNNLIEFNEDEIKDNHISLEVRKEILLNKIEKFRKYAMLNRTFGNDIKKAYKEISYQKELDDVIQPVEIIEEDQKKKPSLFNLGVLDHEKTFEYLERENIISDLEHVLLTKMTFDKKEKFVIKKIKENNPDIKEVVYFKNIEDFRNKNGYTVNKENTNKRKLKNK